MRSLFNHHRLRPRLPQHPQGEREGAERGQSLVEFALVLPIILLIVAAIVEVGNLLAYHTRLQNAARVAARAGAAGVPDLDLYSIVINSLQSAERYEVDPEHLEVWVIRPAVARPNPSGPLEWQDAATTDPPWGVEEVCIWGQVEPCPDAEEAGPATSEVLPSLILDDLEEIGDMALTGVAGEPSLVGVRMSIVVIKYDVPTILNMPIFQIADPAEGGRVPMRVYSVMRQEVLQSTIDSYVGGCSAYPIIIQGSALDGKTPGESGIVLNHGSQFDFVAWRAKCDGGPCDTPAQFADSIVVPGNSRDANYGFLEYALTEADDPNPDTAMHIGDWLLRLDYGSSAEVANEPGVMDALNDHKTSKRLLRVPYTSSGFQSRSGDPPDNVSKNMFKIAGFVVIRIDYVASDLSQLNITFVNLETSCGVE